MIVMFNAEVAPVVLPSQSAPVPGPKVAVSGVAVFPEKLVLVVKKFVLAAVGVPKLPKPLAPLRTMFSNDKSNVAHPLPAPEYPVMAVPVVEQALIAAWLIPAPKLIRNNMLRKLF